MLSPLLGSRAIEPDFPKYCYFPFPPLFHPQSLHATSSKRLMLWAETRDFACEIAVTSGLKKIDSPISNSNQFSLEILDIDHKRQDRSFNKCILRSMASADEALLILHDKHSCKTRCGYVRKQRIAEAALLKASTNLREDVWVHLRLN